MKKSLFIAFLAGFTVLTSCGTPGTFKEKNIKINFQESKPSTSPLYTFNYQGHQVPSKYNVVDENDFYGLVGVEINGRYGVYSLKNNSLFVATNSYVPFRFYNSGDSINIDSENVVIRFAGWQDASLALTRIIPEVYAVYYGRETIIADSLGNRITSIYDRSINEVFQYGEFTSKLQDDKNIYTFKLFDKKVSWYYEANTNRLVKINLNVEDDDEDELGYGDNIFAKNRIDLAEYNLPYYSAQYIGGGFNFYKRDKFVRTFKLPQTESMNTQPLVFDGTILYQLAYELPVNAKKYTLIYGPYGAKYDLKTFVYDIAKGKKKEIKNFNYLITDANPYKSEGVYKYVSGAFAEINKKKMVSGLKYYIMNKELVFVKETNPYIKDYEDPYKFGNNYIYRGSNAAIINSDFGVVADLSNYRVETTNFEQGIAKVTNETGSYLINDDGQLLHSSNMSAEYLSPRGDFAILSDKYGATFYRYSNKIKTLYEDTNVPDFERYRILSDQIFLLDDDKLYFPYKQDILYFVKEEVIGVNFYDDAVSNPTVIFRNIDGTLESHCLAETLKDSQTIY